MLVPVLLQLALIIFLIGLVILLWNLHTIVAAVSSTFTGLLFLFLLVVTGLPSYRWDCCYRAPQALLVYTVVRNTRNKAADLLQWCIKVCSAYTSNRFLAVRFWWSLLQQGCGILSRGPKYPTWQAQERLDLRKQSGALNVETAITAYYTTLDPLCLDRMRISLSGEADAPLVRCLRALDVGIGNGTIAPAALLKQNVRGRLSSMVLTALRQMLTIESRSRDTLWEPTIQRLFSMCTVMVPGERLPHNDLILKTAFYIAMQTTSPENLYMALNYLATAVNVDSPVPCDYLTVSRVLSAAEQWIEKQQLSGEAENSASIAPQNNIVAFYIVVHCMLCVMTKKTAIPEPHRDHFAALCTRACGALSSLPNFLPTGETLLRGMPHGNEYLCNTLSFGLQLLLGPLTRLSQSIDTSSLVHETPLIHEDVVGKLEDVWGTAEAVLRPSSRLPGESLTSGPRNISPKTRPSITDRLRVLQDDVNSLFPQVFGPVLAIC
ncbi:hypothetical protein GY45DRAFT_1264173 [Cubamyces sp. BRFM 1775]|nr:hypothetical protein GY45DRAFT_1264173 [Cubamyces sp. BRFM 1775]